MTSNVFWPYRWFGFWKEMGQNYQYCPSILDFVDDDSQPKDKDGIANYLKTCSVVWFTSYKNYPCVFNGPLCPYGQHSSDWVCFRTDGVWSWLDNLEHYFLFHHVQLPETFIQHMKDRGFQTTSGDALADVPTPQILSSFPDGVQLINTDFVRELVEKTRESARQALDRGDKHEFARLYGSISEHLSVTEEEELRRVVEELLPDLIRARKESTAHSSQTAEVHKKLLIIPANPFEQ